ncbi:MAG: GNAT family N-acetyltransferase [Phycisphaeraceae bacterium]|nr:GNAT family N-acetyltransferase [Phycisphaeraceae bacterium]
MRSDSSATVVRLGLKDADAFMDLRRSSLTESPWAFASSPEDDRMRDVENVRKSLSEREQATFGVREVGGGGRILAVGGVMREPRLKRRHIASIYGVYTRPEARGRGLGRAVTVAAIMAAKEWVGPAIEVVELSVSRMSDGAASAAERLYESLGFVAWGLEPEALRTADGRTYVNVHMQLTWARFRT